MAHFLLKLATFRYHGNKARPKVNFRDTVKLRDLEKPVWCKNFGDISYISKDIANLVLKFTNFHYHGNKGRCGVYFNDTVKLGDTENPLFGLRISAIFITQAVK